MNRTIADLETTLDTLQTGLEAGLGDLAASPPGLSPEEAGRQLAPAISRLREVLEALTGPQSPEPDGGGRDPMQQGGTVPPGLVCPHRAAEVKKQCNR